MDLILFQGLLVVSIVLAYLDNTLGMGYGTTLAPIPLIFTDSDPLSIVVAILVASFVTGVVGGIAHHAWGNADLRWSSREGKVAAIMSISSVAGVVLAAVVALNINPVVLEAYIAFVVVLMGFLMLTTRNRHLSFSWGKIAGLSAVAAFNKGMSGGGYGPVAVSGQVLSGINIKKAIGATVLAEGLACLIGAIVYVFSGEGIDLGLALPLILGSLVSIPISTYTVFKADEEQLRGSVAVVIIILGAALAVKLLLF